MRATLVITNGTIQVDLLGPNSGFSVKRWLPAIATEKGGGVWQSSMFSDGRTPVTEGPYDNVIETIELVERSNSQDASIRDTQNLRRLARSAKDYFASRRTVSPVWIEARAERETNTRYATIYNWATGPDGDPFASPFLSANCESAMPEFVLTLERGHWRSTMPLEADCVPVNLYDANAASYLMELGNSGSGDIVAGEAFIDIDLEADTWINDRVSAYLYESVMVEREADILTAWFSFYVVSGSGAFTPEFNIYGFAQDDAPALVDGEDILLRPITSAYMPFSGYITAGIVYTFDVSTIVREITSRAGWVPGNNIGFIVRDMSGFPVPPSLDVVGIVCQESDYGPGMKLIIATEAASPACSEAFIINSSQEGVLDYYYYYDDSAATYSANLIVPGALPVDLFPVLQATNDYIYIGSGVPFITLLFDISTAGNGITAIDWEYWNAAGGSWQDTTEQDNTVFFTSTGRKTIIFTKSGWGMTTVNSKYAYWIRGKLTVSGASIIPEIDNPILTVKYPYIEIPSSSVGGDIAALCKQTIEFIGYQTTVQPDPKLVLGLRSLERGEDFTAYINFAQFSNPNSVVIEGLGEDCSFQLGADYPAGQYVRYLPNDLDFEERVRILLSDDFLGVYHVYLRVHQTGGSAGDLVFQMTMSGVESSIIALTGSVSATTPGVVDFGIFEYNGKVRDAAGNAYSIIISGARLTAADPNLTANLIDLILIPTDEYTGQFTYGEYIILSQANESTIIVDSVTNPRKDIEAFYYSAGAGGIYSPMRVSSSGPAILNNDHNQRLWYFFMQSETVSFPTWTTFGAYLYKTQRYFGGRGDR
jgi:hypothetical protein